MHDEPQDVAGQAAQDSSLEVAPPPMTGQDDDFDQGQAFGSVGAPPPKPKVSKTTMGMIGLFIAGVGVVGIMSLRDGPAKASATDKATEQQVEDFLAKSGPKDDQVKQFQDTKEVVDTFYHYASRHQVPLDDLNSNPFVFGDKKDAAANAGRAAGNKQAKLAAKRRAELHAEFSKLKLQSVMMGPRGGTAIIDNNFLAKGHKIGSFTVAKIDPNSVELTHGQMTLTLQVRE